MLNTMMEKENTSFAKISIPFLRYVHSIKIFFIKILVKIIKIVCYLWQHIYKSIKIKS